MFIFFMLTRICSFEKQILLDKASLMYSRDKGPGKGTIGGTRGAHNPNPKTPFGRPPSLSKWSYQFIAPKYWLNVCGQDFKFLVCNDLFEGQWPWTPGKLSAIVLWCICSKCFQTLCGDVWKHCWLYYGWYFLPLVCIVKLSDLSEQPQSSHGDNSHTVVQHSPAYQHWATIHLKWKIPPNMSSYCKN